MSQIPPDYQVDHLLLLVGSNPVPNAVAGKLLTTRTDSITLIHSVDDGFKLAKRMQEWFVRAGYSDENIGLEEIKESDAVSVSTTVEKVLDEYKKEILKQGGRGSNSADRVGPIRIGLNYTGGTKVMSVHAYLALKNWVKNKGEAIFDRHPVFSYLDARTLEMRFEQVGMLPPTSFPTGRKVSMSIRDLLDLHNWEPLPVLIKEPILPESMKALLAIHTDTALTKLWNEWVDTEIKKDKKERDSRKIPWPKLLELQEALSKELGQHNPQFLDLTTQRLRGAGAMMRESSVIGRAEPGWNLPYCLP